MYARQLLQVTGVKFEQSTGTQDKHIPHAGEKVTHAVEESQPNSKYKLSQDELLQVLHLLGQVG